MFINSINNFRAFSIFMIVLSHTYWISNVPVGNKIGDFYIAFTFGGTFYFLFISGFLFDQLSLASFDYYKYMIKKIRNVVSPYVVMSFLPILIALNMQSIYPEYFFSSTSGIYSEYVKPFFLYLFTGRALTGYWYIPFIFLIFILAPFFKLFKNISLSKKFFT